MSIAPIPKTVTEQLKLVKSGQPSPVSVVRMDTIDAEPVEWLWKPFIARKKLTAMTGEEGIGKSWITCALASIVSHGGWFPNTEQERVEPENVLFLASEDGLKDTLKPRLTSVKAEQSKVFTVANHFSFDDMGILRFYNLIGEIRPALVIIDPFFSYLKGGLNINLSTEIRPITSRLSEIADEFNSAFLLVRHIGKARGMGEARNAGLGSIDFRAVCRSELLIGKNPENQSEGAIVQIKNNLSEYGKAVGYQIKDGELLFMDTDLTAERLLQSAKNEDERHEQGEAVAFLREVLATGEMYVKDVQMEARNYGITDKMLRTARGKLGVEITKRGNAFGKQKFFWSLKQD